MQPVKPGYLTTEFYLHGGMQILSLLVLVGFVNAGDQTALGDSWAKAVAAVATLITSGFSFYHYIKSRTLIKTGATPAVGTLSPTSIHSNAAVLPVIALLLFAAPTFAQAQVLRVTDRPPIIETASNTVPPYFLPWRAWMHQQLAGQQAAPAQPIIINSPTPSAPAAPSSDPTVIALLQQQVQLHQQQVFLQQQIASLMTTGLNHLQTAPASPAPTPAPIYYPVPPGVQPFPAAPPAPVQPLPMAPQYPAQPLPVAPLYPVQPLPIAPVAPVQPLPLAPPRAPQVLPIAPLVSPQPEPNIAPKTAPAPQPLPVAPVMPPATSYNRFTTLTHAICAPVK